MDWEELYRKYNQRTYNYIFLMVGNQELAEDLTHDTFLKVRSALDSFRFESSHYSWIISISRNVIFDHWRKRKVLLLSSLSTINTLSNETPEAICEKSEEIQELYRAIRSLKISYQEVIILRKIQELSIVETAEALGWSQGKVKTTLRRALEALRETVEKQEKGDEHFGQSKRT